MPQLILVGVGPGDPDLLTIAAVRAIQAADVVAYPVARAGAEGMAARIASPWLGAEQRRLPLVLPMVAEAEPRIAAWHAAADALAAEVSAGRAVVLLCEGDASLFASGSYVLMALQQRHPQCPFRVIAGITAVAAAAAAASRPDRLWPLALQRESLLICPTPDSVEALETLLNEAAASARVLALLKLGPRWSFVRPLLERRGLLADALFAHRVGWPEQQLLPADRVSATDPSYFSLLLIRQGLPAVLP